jgi:hypothetical protein
MSPFLLPVSRDRAGACRSLGDRSLQMKPPWYGRIEISMALAPDPILSAGLESLRFALICCRNWTLRDDVPIRQVNELMEAIHEIPGMLANWEGHGIDELRTHFGCFDTRRWRTVMDDGAVVPDLVALFEQRLSELEGRS